MTKRNPKQEGSNVWDCKPQSGPCPVGCNQCFYNRPGAFYVPTDEPHMPELSEVGDGIMRVNSGHDSNIQREKVIADTARYPKRFFNTSIPNLDFPAPVVLTANPQEEDWTAYHLPQAMPNVRGVIVPDNLMFVRLRASASNLRPVTRAAWEWAREGVPVVITFMAYYDVEPPIPKAFAGVECYVWKTRHVNSYWCPTRGFMREYMRRFGKAAGTRGRLVTMCGTPGSAYCTNCRNCETYYYQTIKRMEGVT